MSRMLVPIRLLTLLALLCAGPATATATMIQADFAGIVDGPANGPAFDGSISVGTPFQGYLIYDDAQAPQSTTATSNTYGFTVPPWSLHLEIGNYVVEAGPAGFQVQITNAPASDGFAATASAVTFTAGSIGGEALLSSSVSILVVDADGSTLASSNLADVPHGPIAWPFSNLHINLFHEDFESSSVQGNVTSFALNVVPEPATLGMLALGCAALARRRR